MPRRRFRNSHNGTLSSRSYQELLANTPTPEVSRTELLRMIRGGEDTYFELKVKLSNSERISQGIVALANTDGGVFVFGVSDQLRVEGVENALTVRDELVRICREDIFPPLVPLVDCISYDNGRQIVVLEVVGKKPPYRTKDGRFYMRFGAEKRETTREELSNWLDEIRPLYYENIPVIGATEKDIDDALLWTFAKAFEDEIDNKFAWETNEFLRKDLLLAVGSNEDITPTIAAILLFGKNERVSNLIPRSVVNLTRFAGKNAESQVIEKIEISGNLLTLFEQILRFINRYCDLVNDREKTRPVVENSPIQARSSYHKNSIREAIANALMHRDLAIRDVSTRINIFDDAIEILNPRRTNGFVPPASKAIRYGITQRINPQIAAIFSKPEYGIEDLNDCLPNILRFTREFSNKRTEIYTTSDEFRMKIYGN
jgi:ATP-dependent DNA helicase RecG